MTREEPRLEASDQTVFVAQVFKNGQFALVMLAVIRKT